VRAETKILADALVREFKHQMAQAVGPLEKQVVLLEARLNALPKPERGEKGEPGVSGKDGLSGKDGVDGKDGAPGKDGRDGIDGKDGAVGEKGEPGINGKDGAPGLDGKPGERGEKGVDGLNGKDGAVGSDGKDGRDGRDGKDGAAGVRGEKGDPGRDALAIDILPTIDETKSYPRGTFAEYRGGTIRAIRNTDPITGDLASAGWSIAARGVWEETEELLADGRTTVRKTCSSARPSRRRSSTATSFALRLNTTRATSLRLAARRGTAWSTSQPTSPGFLTNGA
jgi:hypothetical protein